MKITLSVKIILVLFKNYTKNLINRSLKKFYLIKKKYITNIKKHIIKM
jgi:uncharacterized protein with von Willebrand factor type A (vWA) domain